MSTSGKMTDVERIIVSLPPFEEIAGHLDLERLATRRRPFEGGPEIVSVPVSMTITAPRLIFQTEVKLIYTSGKDADYTIIRSPLQKDVKAIVDDNRFQLGVAVAIVLNCVALAADKPSNEGVHAVILAVEVAVSIFFFLEALLSMYGLTWKVYISSNWHKLDLIVAVEGAWFVLAYFTGQNAVDISALRLLRVLRPLRTVSHISELQEAVEVIINALPSILNSFVLYFIFLVFAAVFMLQLAVNSLTHTCDGSDYDDLEQPTFCSPAPDSGCISNLFVPFDCDGRPALCTRAEASELPIYPNFDNFFEAILTIFRISTLDGWAPALWHMQNAIGGNVVFVFVALILIGPCVVTNLCIAAVLKHYSLMSMLKVQKKKDDKAILDVLRSQAPKSDGDSQHQCPKCSSFYLPDAGKNSLKFNLHSKLVCRPSRVRMHAIRILQALRRPARWSRGSCCALVPGRRRFRDGRVVEQQFSNRCHGRYGHCAQAMDMHSAKLVR